MTSFPRVLLAVSLLTAPIFCAGSSPSKTPDSPIYVMTNDDGVLHNYVSFFIAGGLQGSPTLTFQNNVITGGKGIGGGFFASPRVNLLPDSSAECVYASDAGTGDIAAINIQAQKLAGTFSASPSDVGDANGIGLVLNTNYLYAGYSTSNTIATFVVLPGCQLSYVGDVSAAGLNGGSPSGMALHGNILVVAYADGSIESFNIANGTPVSNGDAQNSTGYANAYFPEGVDISSDGHFAIFGDSSVPTTVEVSDISSGKLTATAQYTVGTSTNAVGSGLSSTAVRLSPDESMLYVSNSDGGTVSAAFFNKQSGRVTRGCTSPTLHEFYNPWGFVASLATRDTSGTGGLLYVAEFGFTESFIAMVEVQSDGITCTLSEPSTSPVEDLLSGGLLSIQVFPPRPF